MNKQSLAAALSHTFHCSSRLLNALLHHGSVLFANIAIERYVPPLESGAKLPEDPIEIEHELRKQESLLTQIHKEMNVGCISKPREELLWEVQRIITQLKRKLKNANKSKEVVTEKSETVVYDIPEENEARQAEPELDDTNSLYDKQNLSVVLEDQDQDEDDDIEETSDIEEPCTSHEQSTLDNNLNLLQLKNDGLHLLRDTLIKNIQAEKNQIAILKPQMVDPLPLVMVPNDNLDEVMDLFKIENQILQIKKIHLVRQIIEEQEICIELKAQILGNS